MHKDGNSNNFRGFYFISTTTTTEKMKLSIKLSHLLKKSLMENFFVQCTLFNLVIKKTNFKNFMAPFYGWGSTASRLEPLRGGSLLFTIQFPEIPGTHFINLGRMKG